MGKLTAVVRYSLDPQELQELLDNPRLTEEDKECHAYKETLAASTAWATRSGWDIAPWSRNSSNVV